MHKPATVFNSGQRRRKREETAEFGSDCFQGELELVNQ
jgi:hypothetical protein